MKFRTDFVTNSSSSNFVACGINSKELADVIRKVLGGEKCYRPDSIEGFLEITYDDIVCATAVLCQVLPFEYFYIDHQGDWDERTDAQIQSDNRKACKPDNIFEVLCSVLPDITMEKRKEILRLIKEAKNNDNVICETFVDQTDDSYERVYSKKDIIENKVKKEKGELVIPKEMDQLPKSLIDKNASAKKLRFEEGSVCDILSTGSLDQMNDLEEVILPEKLVVINAQLFKGKTKLRTVVLPPHLATIDKEAFSGCINLQDIKLPESVIYIDPSAFEGCSSLPDSVKESIKRVEDNSQNIEKEHESNIEYIRQNGDSDYLVAYESFFKGKRSFSLQSYIFTKSKKEILEKWHSENDYIFDNPSKVLTGSQEFPVYFSVLANQDRKNAFLMDYNGILSGNGWIFTERVSKTTRYLLVDTEKLPETLLRGTSSLLRDAMKNKNSGSDIEILSISYCKKMIGD